MGYSYLLTIKEMYCSFQFNAFYSPHKISPHKTSIYNTSQNTRKSCTKQTHSLQQNLRLRNIHLQIVSVYELELYKTYILPSTESQIRKPQMTKQTYSTPFNRISDQENTTFHPGTRLISIKLVLENFLCPPFILYLQNFQTGLTMQPA